MATDIKQYPQSWVSYLLPTEWRQAVRIELFEKDVKRFQELARWRRAMDAGDMGTFNALRHMLCGSTRDWLCEGTLSVAGRLSLIQPPKVLCLRLSHAARHLANEL